jgi:uncharacterized protein (DUF362 family)
MSKVSLTRTDQDLHTALIRAIDDVGVRLVTRGDRVLIKPNLVEPEAPDSGEITTPRLIEAVARYCLDHGASRVIIGEGPSYYQPESHLRECFTRTGVSSVAEHLGIEWVLFDDHSYRTFRGVPDCPKEFRVTEFAFTCDKFINLPVLKTHYLTTVTLAMKNLKGCLKREDKPLFHRGNLSRAVVELCRIVRPTINIIDCTAETIGSIGYSDRKQPTGRSLLIAGSDIVAVDAVGCALMGIDPSEVDTVTLGAAAGLGESDLTRMDIVGEELKWLKFKVKLPREELRQNFPLLEIVGAERACSGCLIPLRSSLLYLQEQGINLKEPLKIYLGTEIEVLEDRAGLLLGDCAQVKGTDELPRVGGCPPDKEELITSLISLISSNKPDESDL